MSILNKETAQQFPKSVSIPSENKSRYNSQIMHIGIGGFHRSHQAYAIAKLLELDAERYASWRITGVGLMPNDKNLVNDFRQQQYLYALCSVSSDESEEVRIIDAIANMLHAEWDADEIINKIADISTKVISFTITEGGYLVDFESQRFKIEDPRVQADINEKEHPQTVFGFLAKGLALRIKENGGPLTLLSCDNILGNGHILRLALFSFLEAYDISIKKWAEKHISFPNSMVDRITPVPTLQDKISFENQYGIRDNCLVVSEDYFQWVIEKEVGDLNFPPLQHVGVDFVEDVSDYEAMKLGILNAGHTLVGLLGTALGYSTIHDAVKDSQIAAIYKKFVLEEVIPVLKEIPEVDYHLYFNKVNSRFSNAMINDSTARIISGSSDKFPKFVLPTIHKQLSKTASSHDCSALIIAAWWSYLDKENKKDKMFNVDDQLRPVWLNIFLDESTSIEKFISYSPVFGDLRSQPDFYKSYLEAIKACRENSIRAYLEKLITNS